MMTAVKKDIARILLVEDNPGDARLTQEALKEAKFINELHWVKDGVEALDYLYKRGAYKDAVPPDLVLLDLNLPKKSGQEVLEEIKKDPKLLHIPVIVLSTSKADEDIARSYSHHANCFITKPVDFGQFMNVVRQVENFWVGIVTLKKD